MAEINIWLASDSYICIFVFVTLSLLCSVYKRYINEESKTFTIFKTEDLVHIWDRVSCFPTGVTCVFQVLLCFCLQAVNKDSKSFTIFKTEDLVHIWIEFLAFLVDEHVYCKLVMLLFTSSKQRV
jgi:hypothetical protein